MAERNFPSPAVGRVYPAVAGAATLILAARTLTGRDVALGLHAAAAADFLAKSLSWQADWLVTAGLWWALARFRAEGPDSRSRQVAVVATLGVLYLWLRVQLQRWVPWLSPEREPTFAGVTLTAALLAWACWRFAAPVARHPGSVGKARRVVAGTVVAIAALLAIHAWAWAQRPSAGNMRAVVVVVDSLRADEIYGATDARLPNLRHWAETSASWRRFYSTASWTKPAVASLLTGLSPRAHGVLEPADALPAGSPTLADRLRQRGVFTVFVNGGNAFIDAPFRFDLGFSVSRFVPDAAGVREALNVAFDELKGADTFFAYVHLMDAHLPYRHWLTMEEQSQIQGYVRLTTPPELNLAELRRGAARLTSTERDMIRRLYRRQLEVVDVELERFRRRLQARFPDALLLVTADHGEEFWEHGNFEHGHTLHEELVRVPLLAVGAGVASGMRDEPANLVDLAATMLARAGVAAESGRDLPAGTSLPPARLELVSTLYGPWREAVVVGDRKLQRAVPGRYGWPLHGPATPTATVVYELDRDPGETAPRAATRPEDRALLDALTGRDYVTLPIANRRPADMQRLRSLGYAQ